MKQVIKVDQIKEDLISSILRSELLDDNIYRLLRKIVLNVHYKQ